MDLENIHFRKGMSWKHHVPNFYFFSKIHSSNKFTEIFNIRAFITAPVFQILVFCLVPAIPEKTGP